MIHDSIPGTIGATPTVRIHRLAPPGVLEVLLVVLNRVSSSCGYSVPYFDFKSQRDVLDKWANKQGPDKIREYRAKKNQQSIDGLPAFPTNGI